MKQLLILLVFAILICLVGCIPLSVNPLYTPETIITNPAIEGQWEDPGTDEKYIFVPFDSGSYKMIIKNEGVITGIYQAHLVQVDQATFLDITPIWGATYDDIYNAHILKTHSFYRVYSIDSVLQVSVIDQEWLKDYLDKNPGKLDYFINDNMIVLTSSTESIRQFFTDHLDSENAFGEPSGLKRK